MPHDEFMRDAPNREAGAHDRSATIAPVERASSLASSLDVSRDREAVSSTSAVFTRPGKPKFTAAQRLATFEAFGAIVCCQGPGCENVVRIKGCAIDHHLAWIDGGTHELSNWRPLCDDCHRPKSAGEHRENCKAKRRAKKHRGEWKSKRPMGKSRGFQKHPTLKRQPGGKVVSR